MEFPEVIHQLCDEITAFTVNVFLPILCHFCVKRGFRYLAPKNFNFFNQQLFYEYCHIKHIHINCSCSKEHWTNLQSPNNPIIVKSSGRWMDKAVVIVIVVDNPKILNEILTRVLIKRFLFGEVYQVVWSHNCNGANGDHKSLENVRVQLLGLTAATVQALHCIA